MRPIRKLLILPVVCVTLSLIGVGCDNSSVNESQSPDAAARRGAAAKEGPPPPSSIQ